jgi:hypothetical protein
MRVPEFIIRPLEAGAVLVLSYLVKRKCPYCGKTFKKGEEIADGAGYRIHLLCRKEVYGH